VPAKTILTMLFLISLCVAVILMFRVLPQRMVGHTTAAKDEVLVAATTLPAGSLLRAKDVAWRQGGPAEPGQIARPAVPAGNSAPELDHQAREVYGATLRSNIMAGEPITRGALVKPGDRDFLEVVLSPQARAIAIPVAAGGAGTGILYPGDRVDVILTQTFKNDPPLARRSVGETVVEDLRVLAIDALDARPNSGRTVTLEVTPEEAERVNVAIELGKLSLTLRSASAAARARSGIMSLVKTVGVRPIWAGDVSPALGDAAPAKVVVAEPPAVEVIHGTKAAAVKPR
jgi:pilus assembly protein CpaB